MAKNLPEAFYHSISQANLRTASERHVLPGLSRFHLDPDGKMLGVWLSPDLNFVVQNRYGQETSDEVIDVWDAEFMAQVTGKKEAEALVIKKGITPIILELTGLDRRNLLPHPLFENQYFFIGDIEFDKIKRFLIPRNDEETEVVARELAERIARNSGLPIGVDTYEPMEFLDRTIKEELSNDKGLRRLLDQKTEDKEGRF